MCQALVARLGPRLIAIGIAIGFAVMVLVGFGLLSGADDEPSRSEPTKKSANDLHLVVRPRPAVRGDAVRLFVQGEPPIGLRARPFVDLLSEGGEPLYRLDSAKPGRPVPAPVEYPLPPSYLAPAGTVNLQARRRVRLPVDLAAGRYTLQGQILGRDRYDDGATDQGRPAATIPVRARE